jgi:hypothetical protein
VSAVVNDFVAGFGLEASFPGRDEGGAGNDFAGRVDGAHIFENIIGYRVFRDIGHKVINALFAGIGKMILKLV